MKFLEQYKGLSREVYVFFFGRIVTSMGALIWPILTLILKNKLGYSATYIATITMVMSIVQFPMVIIGGKLADHVDRKKIIICADLVTVVCYVICGFIPLSFISVILFYLAGVFATIEGPAYDAIIADLSDSENRERAYSLQYLGMNLGLVLAPTIGGLLFEKYLNIAFFITGIATLSSTLLIIFFVKKVSIEKDKVSAYEEKRHGESLITIIKERKIILLFFLGIGLGGWVYSQFNYLLPLNLEKIYGAKGATIFGLLTSVNAVVVVIATPLVTTFLGKIMDVRKLLIGETLIALGLVLNRFVGTLMPFYFILMVVFTVGEVFQTIGNAPYMTRRMPSTHWGRINSVSGIFNMGFSGIGNLFVGRLVDAKGYNSAWVMVSIVGAMAIATFVLLAIMDKKTFRLLYESEEQKE